MTNSNIEQSEQVPFSSPEQTCCSIVELRQYTLYPGKRDVLIDLFDREFIESQEALGIRVLGQFRDVDDANRFVWLRGFGDMPARALALQSFYGGPVWKAHREEANDTMIDSDNVLLLRPARPASGFLPASHRPPLDAKAPPGGLLVATIYYLGGEAEEFVEFFERTLDPLLVDTGASTDAYFVTEKSANNFPALPVREGENVFVWFSSFPDQEGYADHVVALFGSRNWSNVSQELTRRLERNPEVLKLSPTSRSQLRGLD